MSGVRFRLLFAALIALILMVACGSEDSPAPANPIDPTSDAGTTPEPPQEDLSSLEYKPSFEPDYNNLTAQPWVQVATKAAADGVVVFPDRLEFSKAQFPDVLQWSPGRVEVSAPGEGAGKNPFGYARRVKSVVDQDPTIVVYTETVSLEDVVTGDFQAVFPTTAKPVDLSKVDLDWAAANLYQDLDIVAFPGEPLPDDDTVFFDEAGNVIAVDIADLFLGKLWKKIKKGVSKVAGHVAAAAKKVVQAAQQAWVAITPPHFTGSVNLNNELRFEQSAPLFSFELAQNFNQAGKLPMQLFIRGSGGVSSKIVFNPGLQVGARIPNIGHKSSFGAWLNIDSRAETKIAMDLALEAGIASADGISGSALEERINNDVNFAQNVYNTSKDRLLGSPDMKPAGGWKRTLFISKPATHYIQAGPVPVILTATFQLDLECGFEAKASLKAKLEFEQNATFKFRVNYENGKATVATPPTFQNRKRRNVEITGGGAVQVTCGLIPRVNAFVYDAVGLFAGVRGSLVARAAFDSKCEPSATNTVPKGEVTLGLYGNVGVQVGARVQAPGSSYAGKAGQAAGIDIGPFEVWNTEFEIVKNVWKLDKGLGYCTPQCRNLALEPVESDVDCGGPCSKCALGKKCKRNSDCGAGYCTGGTCNTNHCGDGVRDGDETGVDCGGKCAKCGDGRGCNSGNDCASGFCNKIDAAGFGACVSDHCIDGVQDGNETGLDCGGKCQKCKVGQRCSVAADCETGISDGIYCVAASCNDRQQNGGETDVDCGGDNACRRCGAGQACAYLNEPQSGNCAPEAPYCDPTTKKCTAICKDGVQSGDETDVDCGGACGATCGPGKKCIYEGDCIAGLSCSEAVGGSECRQMPR